MAEKRIRKTRKVKDPITGEFRTEVVSDTGVQPLEKTPQEVFSPGARPTTKAQLDALKEGTASYPEGIKFIPERTEQPVIKELLGKQRSVDVEKFIAETEEERAKLPLSELQQEQQDIIAQERVKKDLTSDPVLNIFGVPDPEVIGNLQKLSEITEYPESAELNITPASLLEQSIKSSQKSLLDTSWERADALFGGIDVFGLSADGLIDALTGREDAEALQSGLGKLGTIASTLEGIKAAGGDSVTESVARLNSLDQDLNILEKRIQTAIRKDPKIRRDGKYVDIIVDIHDQRTSIEEARAKVILEEATFDPMTLQLLNTELNKLVEGL